MSSDNEKRKEDFEKIRVKFGLVDAASGAAVQLSGATRTLVQDIKGGYQDLRGTFNVDQVELSQRYQFDEKIEAIDDNLGNLSLQVTGLREGMEEIIEQTRDPTIWERTKETIFDNLIWTIFVLIAGIILGWFLG